MVSNAGAHGKEIVDDLLSIEVLTLEGEVERRPVERLGLAYRTSIFKAHGQRTLGPAESFRVSWREDAPGTWLYHCHVEQHMEKGMIGIYRVSR